MVVYSVFRENLFGSFGATEYCNLPFYITLAIGFYFSLYYWL